MVVENLTGEDFAPPDCAKFAIECGARVSGGTDMKALGEALCARFGLTMSLSNSVEAMCAALDNGGVAVVNVGGDRSGYTGLFSDGGHYVVAVCYDGGRVGVLDPGYYSGKFDKSGRRGKVEKVGDVCWCEAEDLDLDAQNRSPRYYIFERGK